jgi:hypothetical protein
MNKTPIIGQEAVVPDYGLSRVVSVGHSFIEVKPYTIDYTMKFDPKNVKLVKINLEEDLEEDTTISLKTFTRDITRISYNRLFDFREVLEEEEQRRDHEPDYADE